MTSKQLLLCLACTAVLAGCASTEPAPAPALPTMAALLQQADSALKAGQTDAAVATLKVAAKTYPADKTARLRIAQVSFDCHEYGEAITHAKKVLELDANDVVAQSLLAVSGLRVSSKALAELTARNKIMTGDVRTEAENLAAILRASVGGDIIVASDKSDGAKRMTRNPAGPLVQRAPKSTTQELLEILNTPNVQRKK